MADEILIINVGGHIGDSTHSEIEYARKTGKEVKNGIKRTNRKVCSI